MAISQRRPARDVLPRMLAWATAVVTYLTLWSAGLGWMHYWWAWFFVLVPILLSWLTWRPPGPPAGPADGFRLPRVRFPTSHRRHRRHRRSTR